MQFADPVIFEIPVYPRTQKYIRAKLQDAQGNAQPLIASPFSQGISLHLWLTAQARKVRMVAGRNRRAQRQAGCTDKAGYIITPPAMTACIGLGIEHFHHSRHQYLLNYQELEQFAHYVDFLILQELVGYCQAAPQVMPAVRISEFTERYGFTQQDFSSDRLRRHYARSINSPGGHPFRVQVTALNPFSPTHTPCLA